MKQLRLGILGGLAALAVGTGIAAAGVGYLLQSLPSARAAEGIGPTVTGGTHPWVNLTGVLDAMNASTVLYTVPPDRILVLTGGCVDHSSAELFQDGTLKLRNFSRLLDCDDTNNNQDNAPGLLRQGNAHVVFEPGTQVIVTVNAPNAWSYYLEGYLAHP